MTQSLPSQVKVGATVYRIEEWPARDANRAHLLGEADHSFRRIRIDTSYGGFVAAVTLLHEILHCVWIGWRLGTDNASDERIIESFERGLAAVWVDNPELMRWIGEQLRAG